MHSADVKVGRQSSNVGVGSSSVHCVDGVTGRLLLVRNVVLCGGLDTGILVTSDGLLHGDTREVGIGSKAFPITASIGGTTERSGNGTERNVSALGPELLTHSVSTLMEQFPVPGSGSRNTS